MRRSTGTHVNLNRPGSPGVAVPPPLRPPPSGTSPGRQALTDTTSNLGVCAKATERTKMESANLRVHIVGTFYIRSRIDVRHVTSKPSGRRVALSEKWLSRRLGGFTCRKTRIARMWQTDRCYCQRRQERSYTISPSSRSKMVRVGSGPPLNRMELSKETTDHLIRVPSVESTPSLSGWPCNAQAEAGGPEVNSALGEGA